MSKQMLIIKANDLVEARYKLTLTQQRLVLYLIAQINKGDTDFQTYVLSVADFCKYLQINPNNIYEEFVSISTSLVTKSLIIQKGTETIVAAWLSSAVYNSKTGTITLRFAPELKEFLLELKGHFTKYALKHVKQFRSTYSIRLYELLKQYENLGTRTFEVEELKEILQMKDLYKDYNLFKQRVILTAQREINQKSDIQFDFVEIKNRKRVTVLKFNINCNPEYKDNIQQKPEPYVSMPDTTLALDVSMLNFITEPVTILDKRSILKAADGDAALVQSAYGMAKQQGGINNLTAWLIDMVKKIRNGEVSPPVSVEAPVRKNRFINFQQREIDYAELERLELEQFKAYMNENGAEI